jgi:hypothetical protein
MGLFHNLLIKLGMAEIKAERNPMTIFLLDDDARRHRWFEKRFAEDELDIAETVAEAKEFLQQYVYDAVFLDHDLLPHHYESNDHDDFASTGYAIAEWLFENKNIQRSATFFVHTRNADGAYKMVELLRDSGRQVEYVPFPMLDAKLKTYFK